MQPIEGVDLGTLTKEAQEERLAELKRTTRLKISHIIGRYSTAEGTINNLEKQLKKAKEALVREQERLKKLEAGDWTILQDDQQQGEKKESNGEERQ